ncbi:DUF4214 domain-containing protein [Serratia quinivorans]|uniref:DUF4214 domain-containing protein n=1 Tax=Serratia quinivorans TaxID=137545 RepID=UPI002E795EF8|nr:DUF4214 domain-containing protein [Serratia quinivorans]
MSLLTLQQDVAILFYATLGKKADDKALTYFAKQLEKGTYTQSELATKFILSEDGQHRYDGLTTSQKVQYIYQNTNGTPPDAATLNALTAQVDGGSTLGSLTTRLITETKNYAGSDAAPLSQQQHLENVINTTLYPSQIELPSQISAAENVQGMYYLLGSMVNSAAIDYWSGILDSGKKTAVEMANYFVSLKGYIGSLNNEDFVKKIFSQAFGTAASSADLQKYVSGLNSQSETRGDVMMRMMDDIRNDTSHEVARQNFAAATHVYAPGELPDAKYGEVVMSLYLTVAGVSADAAAMDSFSRLLAGGKTQAEVLNILAKTDLFRNAGDYQSIYMKLYGSPLDGTSAQAILLKAGNDKVKATSLIIDAFREGKYPLDNHPTPPPATLLHDYEVNLGAALGYQKTFNGTFSLSDNGKLMADINARAPHEVTYAEIASLTALSQLNINANLNIAVDLSQVPSSSINKIVLSGDYATSTTVRDSLGNKYAIDLLLTETNIANADATQQLKATNATVESGADLSSAKINLLLSNQLYWEGNSINGGANHIGNNFLAERDTSVDNNNSMISANFITKSIYLTSNDAGGIDGSIVSNINQFLYFSLIDLTHYTGTGNIYMNGQLVATEGSKVFDFGVIDQQATIFNQAYNNVSTLTQADRANVLFGNYTGSQGAIISAYSGELSLINMTNNYLQINGDLTHQSRIHVYDSLQSDKTFNLALTEAATELPYLDMGTFSLTSTHKDTLDISMKHASTHAVERALTLSGGDNHISTLMLTGLTTGPDMLLNLTIKSDFGDNLQTITGIDASMGPVFSEIDLNLVSEKSGTGGGSFYKTLNALANKSDFSHIIDTLAGNQLSVKNTGLTVHSANVKGNTTLDTTQKLTFSDSTIDSMVTLNTGYQNSVITAGDVGNQWIFSKTGDKTATLYGSATTATELKNVFTGLTASDNAQDLFSQVLAKMTNGTSTNNLSEVGLLKLDKSVYVIVDNNHNQTFDADDLVFSIGNQDPYVAAVSLHYQAPAITVNGAAAGTHLVEEMA